LSDYSKDIRRKDRQESDPQFLKELLHNSVSCTIAIQRDGYPLNHVAFFVYDEINHEISFHFSKHGFAGAEIITGKKVCISVYKYGKLYTAKRAVDFGCEYQSVIVYGTIEIVMEEEARTQALDMFFQKFFAHIPPDSYNAFTSAEAHPIAIAKVKIEDWFGKEHRVPPIAVDSFYPPMGSVM
jgi:nitroimidazol reductase NimA-like FMN-containing flavoprotein (pyridoxamine 5'-phosphate oxidase superfamily)